MKTMILGLFLSLAAIADVKTPWELPQMNADPVGTPYKSTNHKNGIFIVEAFFLNCPYCNYNAENVDKLADEFKNDKRVQVLDVGIDTDDSFYKEWINRHHPNHPVLKDARRTLIKQLGTQGYPSTYVFDCKGRILTQTEGQWSDEEGQYKQLKVAIKKQAETECEPDKD